MRSRRLKAREATAAQWTLIGARATGSAHVQRGLPCQDRYGFRTLVTGGAVMALADGVSSARCGDDGARIATEAAIACLHGRRCDTSDDLLEAMLVARTAILDRAASANHEPDDYATTLLLAAVDRDGRLLAAQIGDGAIVSMDGQRNLTLVVSRRDAPYVNQVESLTAVHVRAQIRVATVHSVISVGLISDGLESMAMDETTPFPRFWEPLFRFAAQGSAGADGARMLTEWLASDAVAGATDDDSSLVLASITRSASDPSDG